jgi:hypothetical protein
MFKKNNKNIKNKIKINEILNLFQFHDNSKRTMVILNKKVVLDTRKKVQSDKYQVKKGF